MTSIMVFLEKIIPKFYDIIESVKQTSLKWDRDEK